MYNETQKKILLDTAFQSISYGLSHHTSLPIDITDYDKVLSKKRATFVTLMMDNNLRGCIGILQATRPLVTDVSSNAYSAAFKDNRFPSVSKIELKNLKISISVLSPSVPIEFSSEQDLLNKIRPKIDGLILEDGYRRGTFLPSVWEQVETPKEFLTHLKLKAGLRHDYWSDQIKISRYTTETIS